MNGGENIRLESTITRIVQERVSTRVKYLRLYISIIEEIQPEYCIKAWVFNLYSSKKCQLHCHEIRIHKFQKFQRKPHSH